LNIDEIIVSVIWANWTIELKKCKGEVALVRCSVNIGESERYSSSIVAGGPTGSIWRVVAGGRPFFKLQKLFKF
jgi:hypothetical protein